MRLAFIASVGHARLLRRPASTCARPWRPGRAFARPSAGRAAVVAAAEREGGGGDEGETRASGTLVGRALVEVMSLLMGCCLLLVVVAWRACHVIALKAWAGFVWLGNVRRLGRWAFGRVVGGREGVGEAFRSVFKGVVHRVEAWGGSQVVRSASVVGDEELVSKKELVDVQREIQRMRDMIADGSQADADVAPVRASPVPSEGRRLVLLRHAKSAWVRDSDVQDHERVLSVRGKAEARLVGEELVRREWLPHTVLCSDSARTVETLDLLRDVAEIPAPGESGALCTPALYFAVSGEEMAAAVDDMIESVGFEDNSTMLVVCHNPGCEELVEQLTGMKPEMGTACAALLEFVGDDVSAGFPPQPVRLAAQAGKWKLVDVLRPALLRSSQ